MLYRQCYLTRMVVGFAELGGVIDLVLTAMASGLRLTLGSRLAFEPKALLLEPPARWGGRRLHHLLLLSLRGLLWQHCRYACTQSKRPLLGFCTVGQHSVVEPAWLVETGPGCR